MQFKKILIANWKMNPGSSKEALKLFTQIQKSLNKKNKTEVVICSPFIYLPILKKIPQKRIILGAQNGHIGNVGPFTGEVSMSMLSDFGVKYVILGHSERRSLGESNKDINQKLKAAFAVDVVPVLCIGESKRDPEHSYLAFVKTQIEECLDGVSKSLLSRLVIAYEPIWAIGKESLRPATPSEFLEMSIFIRKVLSDKFGIKHIKDTRIIYGGSTSSDNSLGFLVDGKADGFLVGRDSLIPHKFTEILKKIENA